MAQKDGDTKINVDRNYDSTTSFPLNDATSSQSRVSLRRKLSLAQSFSQRIVTESPFIDPRESDTSWGPSVGQRSDDVRGSPEEVEDGNEPRDEIDDSRRQKREMAMKNDRAKMGAIKLWWFDFKTWYRRWRYKSWENPFLIEQINYIERNFGSGIGALFSFGRWLVMLNIFLVVMWLSFVVIPMAVNFNYAAVREPFAYKNLLDGKGPVAKSWVFYCSYQPNIFANGGLLPSFNYHIGLTYLAMILTTFFGSLFIILRNMAIAQRPSVSVSLNKRFGFAFLLWTSWDFSISSREAATNLRKGITSALKDNMYQAKADDLRTKLERKEKCIIILRRIVAWIITLILVGGGCAAITFLVLYVNFAPADHTLTNDMTVQGIEVTADANFMQVYVTPIAFSFINMLVPLFISKIPLIEKYKTGQTELNVTIARIFMLRMANLFALIMSLYSITLKTTNLASSGVCTGTLIGQEIYKLIIMDTIIHTSVKVLLAFGMYFWNKQKKEFDIPSAVLVLIYRQALIWVGTVVCPILPVVGALSNLVFFFLMYGVVKHTCKPPIKRWRQTRRTFFFMTVLLLTLLCVIVPVSIIIGSTTINLGTTSNPAVLQGPFTGGVIPTSAYSTFANSLRIPELKMVLMWLISNTVVLPLFLILVSVLSYQSMRINGEQKHCLILQAELQQEREDNKKLVKKLKENETYGQMATQMF